MVKKEKKNKTLDFLKCWCYNYDALIRALKTEIVIKGGNYLGKQHNTF